MYFGRPKIRSAKTNEITDVSLIGDVYGVHVELKDLFDVDCEMGGKPVDALDKWLLRFRSLLKGHKHGDIKTACDILRKILCTKKK